MEGVVKRNCNYLKANPNFFQSATSDHLRMKRYSLTEIPFNPNTHLGSNKYSLGNIKQDHIDEMSNYPNNVPNANNLHFSPKKSELEKLFSHATEVKGDLESVIHALVGIIGNSSKDACISNETIRPDNTKESHSHSLNDLKASNHLQDYNYKWQNDNTPSVNVENVLKNVRANKIKYEKFHLCNDSSQSSGSSKERLIDKLDFSMNLPNRNVYKESFRAMFSDPGNLDQSKTVLCESENPRKHKSRFSSMYDGDDNWKNTELFLKKLKSAEPSNDVGDGVSQLQVESIHSLNEAMITDANHGWINANQIGGKNQYPENRCKFTWNVKDLPNHGIRSTDCSNYHNLSNYNWNTNKDVINEFTSNVYADESSCSSWSKISPNNSLINNSQVKTFKLDERKFDKQTPSVSVSDSEGSIEPIRDPPVKRIPRLPSLCTQLRNKQGKFELVLLNQPEQQHRARYMTEGSRGAVKDRTGNGYPTIQLLGWKQAATLQIFVGSEVGRVKPHNFYQACKVTGKQVLSCKERVFDNAGLIEVQLEPKENQTIILDCIGILKLRNVDVERRAGVQRIKQKSTMARLIFRVNLPHGDGYFTCLQVKSEPILCTQPVGTPEISRMSLSQCSCKGNVELFIIGKNIVKCSRIIFQEYSDHSGILWQADAKIDTEYLQQTHLICMIPPYCDDKIKAPVTVQVILNSGTRQSEPRYFTYLPEINENPDHLNQPFKYNDWKIGKSKFPEVPSYPIDNLEINNHMNEEINKSTNELLYDMDYMKSVESSFNVNNVFLTMNNDSNYSNLFSNNKIPNDISITSPISWMQCTASKDIPMSAMPSSNERFSNSLDSNIEGDCMVTDNNIISQSTSIINLSEPNELLNNL